MRNIRLVVLELPKLEDAEEEYNKLMESLIGRRITPQLQAYILDEVANALMKKVRISTEISMNTHHGS